MRKRKGFATDATVGYAADDHGSGVAYVAVRGDWQHVGSLLRIPFKVKRYAGLAGREIGFAALAAVAKELRDRGVGTARIAVADSDLVREVSEPSNPSGPLALHYIRTRCALNQLGEYIVTQSSTDDVTARAKADVALATAA